MRIMQIEVGSKLGGAGRVADNIHSLLLEQNHESYIAFGRTLPENDIKFIKIGTPMDDYIHVAYTRLFDRHGFASKKATYEFIAKIEMLNPDIIHLHCIHGYYINIEILFDFLRKFNKPVVWTFHDCWAFTGHCSHFDYIGCDKWKTGCHHCTQKNEYPSSVLFDNSKNNYLTKKKLFNGINNMTIITPSKWLSYLVKESFLNKYQVKVINNGIDLSMFKPKESNFRKKYSLLDKFIILGIANIWGKKKGFNFFIELSNNLRSDEVIVLVGLTKKQQDSLPANIIGINKTSNIDELTTIYTAADVFVNPTLEDNFPTTNLEALACGTPVITFATGGSVESIDEKTGLIVEKDNINDLRKAINKIRMNEKEFYSNNCIKKCLNFYDKNICFNKYIELYALIIDKNTDLMKVKI